MPVREHPNFSAPASDDVRIWRFMTLPKFLALLESRELFFCPLEALDDPLEGYFSAATIDELRRIPESHPEPERSRRRGIIERNLAQLGSLREYVRVNCWHMNEYESAAMWRLYSADDEGIAIRSTVARLKAALASTTQEVFIGEVKYIDFDSETMSTTNLFVPVLHKRKSFEHERELRAAFMSPDGRGAVPVDLTVLIEQVYVAPMAPAWFVDLIGQLIARYDLAVPVGQSGLLAEPLY